MEWGGAPLHEHMPLSTSRGATTTLRRVRGWVCPPPATLLGGWRVGCGSGELAGSSEVLRSGVLPRLSGQVGPPPISQEVDIRVS